MAAEDYFDFASLFDSPDGDDIGGERFAKHWRGPRSWTPPQYSVTCRRCGKTNLRWKQDDEGWYLNDGRLRARMQRRAVGEGSR